LRRLRHDRIAVIAAGLLALIVLLAIAGPMLSPWPMTSSTSTGDWGAPGLTGSTGSAPTN